MRILLLLSALAWIGSATGTTGQRNQKAQMTRMEHLHSKQIQSDGINRLSTPFLLENFELVSLRPGSIAKVYLERNIWVGPDSSIFTLLDPGPSTLPSEAIVKYQTNCRYVSEDPIHPLVREYLMLKYVENIDIALKAYFLSPPARFPKSVTTKTFFNMPEERWNKCMADPRVNVRYMVMERGSISLFQMMKSLESHGDEQHRFRSAIKMGYSVLRHVYNLHQNDMVHGDIHLDNAVLNKDGRVRLIDFGLAFFEEEKINTPDIIRGNMTYVHCLFSHWNMEGYRLAFRDDAFKTLMMTALLLNGPSLMTTLCGKENPMPELEAFQWRRDKFIFGGIEEIDVVERAFPEWSEELKSEVRNRLKNVLATARSVKSVGDKPDIMSMLNDLNFILAAARPLTTTTQTQIDTEQATTIDGKSTSTTTIPMGESTF